MKIYKMFVNCVLLFAIMFGLSACGFETVSPTEKGKILTPNGYNPEILPSGKYTLFGRDDLVRIQINTERKREKIKIILKDKLTLHANVNFRGRIGGSDKAINAMFSDISPGKDMLVTFNDVYSVYGAMTVTNITREIISDYTAEDVHRNYKRISTEIAIALEKRLMSTPLVLSEITLGEIAYPDVITKAIEAAKERELSKKKQQAQAEIDIIKKVNEKNLAEKEAEIALIKAQTVSDTNALMGEGITHQLLELKRLEVQSEMAKNGSTVFFPYKAMSNLGLQSRIFSDSSK